MVKKKNLIFLFLIAFAATCLFSDWKAKAKDHLVKITFYEDLITYLEANFYRIPAKEKGAASLILAFLNKQFEKSNDVSFWLKRYFKDFSDQDDDLGFLSPECERVRAHILNFREECKKKFPVILIDYDKSRVKYSKDQVYITLAYESSIPCGYEIYSDTPYPLAQGQLARGINEERVQIKNDFKNKGEILVSLLVKNEGYINKENLRFKYPQRKYIYRNALSALSLSLVNVLLINKAYKSDSASPTAKANLDSWQRILTFSAAGLISKSLVDLYKKNRPVKIEKDAGKLYIGFSLSPYSSHGYYAYKQGLKESALREGSHFSEIDFSLSALYKESYEFNLFYRRFDADNVFIEGGLWSTKKSLLGVSLAKVLSVSDANHKLSIDFSGGPFAAAIFGSDFTFIEGQKDDNVVSSARKVSYGLYTALKLRLNFMKEHRLPILTIGIKYFYPFNGFEYIADPSATYRLRRTFLFAGVYF